LPRCLLAVGEEHDDRWPLAEVQHFGRGTNCAGQRRLAVRLEPVDLRHDARGRVRSRTQLKVDILASVAAARTEHHEAEIPRGRDGRQHFGQRAAHLLDAPHRRLAEAHARHRA